MNLVQRARDIQQQVRDALDAQGLSKVLVEVDPAEVPAGYFHGVVQVVAPRIEFVTWTERTETWALHIAAGPADNVMAAWETLNPILEALIAAHINVASAEPASVQLVEGEAPLPGFVVEMTPDETDD